MPDSQINSDQETRERFTIRWRPANALEVGQYVVSIPNYDGGVVVTAESYDRLLAEVETLTERYAAVRHAYGMEAQERGRLEAEVERVAQVGLDVAAGLQAKNEALREALRTYGQHKPGCRREQWLPCGCGLETALATDETQRPSCDADVWDGPYKMRCGHLLVDGKCVRHGERPAAPREFGASESVSPSANPPQTSEGTV